MQPGKAFFYFHLVNLNIWLLFEVSLLKLHQNVLIRTTKKYDVEQMSMGYPEGDKSSILMWWVSIVQV